MNLSIQGLPTKKDSKPDSVIKKPSLNPNAAEFVPSFLRAPSQSADTPGLSRANIPGNSGEELQGHGNLSVANLSLNDAFETPRSSSIGSLGGAGHLLGKIQNIAAHPRDEINERLRFSMPALMEDRGSDGFVVPNLWEKRFMSQDSNLNKGREGQLYSGDPSAGFLSEFLGEQPLLDDGDINPVEFLATQFPGFAVESLADVYYANGGDLSLTIEMLAQLELQVDGGLNQNLTPKTMSAPNLSSLDFPALPVPEAQNGLSRYTGDDLHQASNAYQSDDREGFLYGRPNFSSASRSGIDFAAAVRKLATPDSGQWKYERNGSVGRSVGSSRSSQLSVSSLGGNGRSVTGDRSQNYSPARSAPLAPWLETGDTVAKMYSDLREEARDHARLRNAYFEQARDAYLIGNKALAKELSLKGQWHNMKMKAAHGKAKDAIFQQRNPSPSESHTRAQERLIDLHGLHVNEAIHLLKHELAIIRNTARTASRRLQVLILVGTGHHTKGSRPARLPIAVERYLIEEEGLDYSEPQPGLLRVVV
ncbi:hypothetical protein AMTR_s00024p00246600 [Amborella trichopoda]|uniref:Smr domain-containing protein n=1 Tax=Amborella trichopoda TaxID=13333 RepID=W1PUD9_AMBTC|nr:hypothetical protein AMTR_s00024p00246600 [Amborella trichopoda]